MKTVSKDDKESFIQRQIIAYLKSFSNSILLRLYNCPPYNPILKKFIRSSSSLTPKGLPDLLFISSEHGVHFFEVKSVKSYQYLLHHMPKIRANPSLKYLQHYRNQVFLHDQINATEKASAHFVCCIEHVKQALGGEFEIPIFNEETLAGQIVKPPKRRQKKFAEQKIV